MSIVGKPDVIEVRITQSALWSAYGDALGFITELANDRTLHWRTRGVPIAGLMPWRRKFGKARGATIDIPSGCYSDDTQLRLATSRAIRTHGQFDVEAFSKVELPLWLSYELGGGVGTKAAADNLARQGSTWNHNFARSARSDYVQGGGNGAAMRIQPHVWAHSPTRSTADLVLAVLRNSVTTHGHPVALVGALFHALSLKHVLEGGPAPRPDDWSAIADHLGSVPSLMDSDPDLALVWRSEWERASGSQFAAAWRQALDVLRSEIRVLSSVLSTSYQGAAQAVAAMDPKTRGSGVKCALLANAAVLLAPGDPLSAVRESALCMGTDTDSIASMAGAIGGALAPEIPPPQAVLDEEYIRLEARRMVRVRRGEDVKPFAYPDLLTWRPAASRMDALVLTDGVAELRGLGRLRLYPEHSWSIGAMTLVWGRLQFGQTVLLASRTRAIADLRAVSESQRTAGREGRQLSLLPTENERAAPTRKEAEVSGLDEFARQILAASQGPDPIAEIKRLLSDWGARRPRTPRRR